VGERSEAIAGPDLDVKCKVGQTVWVRGRKAIFRYAGYQGAVVQYQGEETARVVPFHRIATTPPETR
jgi:hypothetical protein